MRVLILFFISLLVISEDYFPGEEWATATADEVGLDESKIEKLFDMTFEDDATMSAVLIKDGYIVKEQYAEGFDQYSFGTSWSTAKSYYAALIGLSLIHI